MLNSYDREIISNVVKTGNFIELSKINKDSIKSYTTTELTKIYKNSDKKKYNFKLAEKISNLLIIDNNKLKKNITYLIATELNFYLDNIKERDRFYSYLNNFSSSIISFPEKKRLIKFLVRFTLISNVLKSLKSKNESNACEILFLYKKIYLNIREQNVNNT